MLHPSLPVSRRPKLASALLALGIVTLGSRGARAAQLYTTSISGNAIFQVDTVALTVTPFLNTVSAADSVMFDSSQNVIYTRILTGEVRLYNPNTLADTLIASGFSGPADIALEPGGNTMLVSEFYGGKIDRIDLNTHVVTTLVNPTNSAGPEGLAYDGSRLFANLGTRSPTAQKYLAEINPITGAVISQSPLLSSLDGLTFDPYTGRLFAASLYDNCVYSFDPNNLANVVNETAKLHGTIPFPDGITTDGVGNIFIASSDSLGDGHIYQLDLISHTLTQNVFVTGLDDLAPASGLGSIAPEPSSMGLLALGIGAILARRRRMK